MSQELGGTRMMRTLFNEITEPAGYSCSQAFMRYKHEHDVEWQELEFHGIGPDGKPFAVIAGLEPAKTNIDEVVRKAANKFVEKMKDGTPPVSS